MDDQTWNEVLTSIGGNQAAAGAPDAEASPSVAEEPVPESAEPVVVESAPDEAPVLAGDPQAVAQDAPAAPPPIDWNHPDLKAVAEKAARLEAFERAVQVQQRVQAAERFQKQLTDLSDGDAERHQQLTGLISQAITPLASRANEAETSAQFEAKRTTAIYVAMEALLGKEQVAAVLDEAKALMAVEGPEVMQRMAHSKRDARQAWDAERSAIQAENAELKRQLAAARELTERGSVDAVDGGGGVAAETLSREERLRSAASQPGNFNEFWNVLTGRNAA